MMKINCIAVDDEPLALDLVENYIVQTNNLVLLEKFRNPIEAFEYLEDHTVDLVFLDIQMPLLSGLELAKIIKSNSGPKIIFTTAYREFAAESYEFSATDYLVKPFSFKRFLESIDKISKALTAERDDIKDEFINVKSEGKTFRVNYEDIAYIESFKDYIKINTAERSLTCYQHITNFLELLPANDFLRIHRSFIINVTKIISYSSTYVQIEQEELPIGRSFKEKVVRRLS